MTPLAQDAELFTRLRNLTIRLWVRRVLWSELKWELLCELKTKTNKQKHSYPCGPCCLLAWRVDSASLKEQGPALGLKICELLEYNLGISELNTVPQQNILGKITKNHLIKRQQDISFYVCVCMWKLLSYVHLFATSWPIQSMEFSRPEYWRG